MLFFHDTVYVIEGNIYFWTAELFDGIYLVFELTIIQT